MTLRIGLHRSTGLVSSLIKWQTRSQYSHASLILPSGLILESMQGKGVVMDRWYNDKGDVDTFTVAIRAEQEHAVIDFAKQQLGKGYDYTMVARFLTRRQATRKSSGKWFCSELVFAAYQEAGVSLLRDTEPWEVSPELLSKSPYLIPAR
jgi:uncharacterized protein YycO